MQLCCGCKEYSPGLLTPPAIFKVSSGRESYIPSVAAESSVIVN